MAIDIIGAFYDLPDSPEELRVRRYGFHVNVCPSVLASNPHLETRIVTPLALRRVWSGDDPAAPIETVALRFNGEVAAREALGDLWPEGAAPMAAPAPSSPK